MRLRSRVRSLRTCFLSALTRRLRCARYGELLNCAAAPGNNFRTTDRRVRAYSLIRRVGFAAVAQSIESHRNVCTPSRKAGSMRSAGLCLHATLNRQLRSATVMENRWRNSLTADHRRRFISEWMCAVAATHFVAKSKRMDSRALVQAPATISISASALRKRAFSSASCFSCLTCGRLRLPY